MIPAGSRLATQHKRIGLTVPFSLLNAPRRKSRSRRRNRSHETLMQEKNIGQPVSFCGNPLASQDFARFTSDLALAAPAQRSQL